MILNIGSFCFNQWKSAVVTNHASDLQCKLRTQSKMLYVISTFSISPQWLFEADFDIGVPILPHLFWVPKLKTKSQPIKKSFKPGFIILSQSTEWWLQGFWMFLGLKKPIKPVPNTKNRFAQLYCPNYLF